MSFFVFAKLILLDLNGLNVFDTQLHQRYATNKAATGFFRLLP